MNRSTLFTLIISLVFISCGKKGAKKDEEKELLGNRNEYSFNQEMKPEETYDVGEMAVAKSVCEAFQNKRAYLASEGGRIQFNLRVKSTTCNDSVEQTQDTLGTMTQNRAGEISLSASRNNISILDDVLTDKHPKVKPFCDSVLANDPPSNTRRDGSNLRYQVNFFQASGYEWLQIVEFRTVNGKFMPYLIERAGIITNFSDDRAIRGFSRYRALNYPCSNRNRGRYTSQDIL